MYADIHDFNQAVLDDNGSLFEAAPPELRVKAIEAVFRGLRPQEILFLRQQPADLGFRCDAVLADADLEYHDEGALDAAVFERIVPRVLAPE